MLFFFFFLYLTAGTLQETLATACFAVHPVYWLGQLPGPSSHLGLSRLSPLTCPLLHLLTSLEKKES